MKLKKFSAGTIIACVALVAAPVMAQVSALHLSANRTSFDGWVA